LRRASAPVSCEDFRSRVQFFVVAALLPLHQLL
jgi:hypothetical protein